MLAVHDLPLFAVTVLLLNATPGVDMALMASSALTGGWRQGIASAFGIMVGSAFHAFLAAFGLAAALAASTEAFAVLRLLGAAYLLYVAYGMARSALKRGDDRNNTSDEEATHGYVKSVLKGLLTNVLNPKIAVFFLALLPQFISADTGSAPLSMLFLGGWFVLQSFCFAIVFVFVVAKLMSGGSAKRLARPANLVGASAIAVIAAKMAVSEN